MVYIILTFAKTESHRHLLLQHRIFGVLCVGPSQNVSRLGPDILYQSAFRAVRLSLLGSRKYLAEFQ
jgi:hypothetical protein